MLKVGLYYTGYLGFHWELNLLLAVVLVWPMQNPNGKRLRQVLAWPVGISLLYYDSYLPTIKRVLSQAQALSNFSAEYMVELAQRLINPMAFVGFLVIVGVYTALNRRIRFSTFALGAILSVPAVTAYQADNGAGVSSALVEAAPTPAPTASGISTAPVAPIVSFNPDNQLHAFYAEESRRKLWFSTGGATPPPFDIIVLHVCSLSWDDMDFVGVKNHPFFKRFDAVFTKFNSGASYSGPASLRVLHGTCGQKQHKALYKQVDPQCYVFPNLEKVGYQTAAVLNHDGVYEDFAKSLEEKSGLQGKIEKNLLATVPVHMHSFDGTPIYNDKALLSQWWQKRQQRGPEPVAMYYNTVSLHDGNKVPGVSSRSSLDTYKPRLEKLLTDFDKFLTELESTGRPVVVMLMPEHGAALRGDKIQISGMREIPSPRITLVPAAIKIIGGSASQGDKNTMIIDQPTSYFGLYSLLNQLLQKSPYDPSSPSLAEHIKTLETTLFVSENEDVIVMPNAAKNGYLLKSGNDPWVPYAY